jgi:hypothetical protein
MNDHGYVPFVVVMVKPSIMCGKPDIILGSTMTTTNEHIHDHSLPHRILGSTMTTTNGTYP